MTDTMEKVIFFFCLVSCWTLQTPSSDASVQGSSDLLKVQMGQNISLNCSMRNHNEIAWYHLSSEKLHLLISAEKHETARKLLITYDQNSNRLTLAADSWINTVSLVISGVTESDLGLYYCGTKSDTTGMFFDKPIRLEIEGRIVIQEIKEEVDNTGEVTVTLTERMLMFGGVGLAVFVFFLATVIAGGIIHYRGWQKGFSAEISVFVQTGASVQLDIQTQELQEFYLLYWINYKSESIVTYISGTKEVKPHDIYKDRVDFNKTTFSLTLKNMQKTDSGLYRSNTIGQSENNIVTYRVSVMDEVEDPVLAVNSSWSSPDLCNFTCKGSNIFISSIYNGSSCSKEEVTAADNHTVRLSCSGDSIMCNYSNPVSLKTQVKKVNELCTVKQDTFCIRSEL